MLIEKIKASYMPSIERYRNIDDDLAVITE